MWFFTETPDRPLELFGPLHIGLLVFVAAGIALIYFFRRPLRRFGHFHLLRYLFAGTLFANMTVYYGSLLLMGTYDVRKHLPLEFCFVTGYLFMFLLLTDNRKLYRVIYYFTVIGPLPAMIWPNLAGGSDRFIFYQFFISHHLMLLMSIYTLVVFEYRVRLRDALHAAFWAFLFFAGVFAVNRTFGTNYIMQNKLPDHVFRLYPFLRSFNVPVFWLSLCGALALGAAALLALTLQSEPERQSGADPEQTV